MHVIFAYYGFSCAGSKPRRNVMYRSTWWARRLCERKRSCRGRINHAGNQLTDPYYGCPKDFVVIAACPNRKIIFSRVAPESSGRYFHLSC